MKFKNNDYIWYNDQVGISVWKILSINNNDGMLTTKLIYVDNKKNLTKKDFEICTECDIESLEECTSPYILNNKLLIKFLGLE